MCIQVTADMIDQQTVLDKETARQQEIILSLSILAEFGLVPESFIRRVGDNLPSNSLPTITPEEMRYLFQNLSQFSSATPEQTMAILSALSSLSTNYYRNPRSKLTLYSFIGVIEAFFSNYTES